MKTPASQIVDVILDFKCLNVPCPTLTATLQAIVDSLCNTEAPSLDYKCLPTPSSLTEFYQSVIDKICETTEPPVPRVYELCSRDVWQCGSASCLVVNQPTTENVLQAAVARLNKLSEVVTTLCTSLSDLETRFNSLQLQVDNIKDCC